MILFEMILNLHQNQCRANACSCPPSSCFLNSTMRGITQGKTWSFPSNQSPHLQGRIAKCSIDDNHGKETDEQIKPNSAKSCNHIINHPTLPVRLLKSKKTLDILKISIHLMLPLTGVHQTRSLVVTLTLREALQHTHMPNQVVDHAITSLSNSY